MIVIVDGHRGRVVFTQHSFRGDAVVRRGSAYFGVANHSWIAEVDVKIFILLEDVIVDHSNCDLWEGGEKSDFMILVLNIH